MRNLASQALWKQERKSCAFLPETAPNTLKENTAIKVQTQMIR